jgi:AcrR family transcriptional regulator
MIEPQTPFRRRLAVQARGEDTRRRILETALDLFAAQGYEGASTRQIADGAGVNLPAIQYYFGNKEGLYRAIIEDIVADTERHMSALAPRVQAALDRHEATPAELGELLCEMLETFVTLVTSGTQVESRRLFFARAEVEETPGIDRLHDNGMRQIFNPCLALLARIHGKPDSDQEMTMRTMALIGQVVIFCSNNKRPILAATGFDEESVRLIKRVVRDHTLAICRAAAVPR